MNYPFDFFVLLLFQDTLKMSTYYFPKLQIIYNLTLWHLKMQKCIELECHMMIFKLLYNYPEQNR